LPVKEVSKATGTHVVISFNFMVWYCVIN